MSELKNGGPASPANIKNNSSCNLVDQFGTEIPPGQTAVYTGMTLRDYFAAKVIQGLLSRPGIGRHDHDLRAHEAFAVADAMLAARSK